LIKEIISQLHSQAPQHPKASNKNELKAEPRNAEMSVVEQSTNGRGRVWRRRLGRWKQIDDQPQDDITISTIESRIVKVSSTPDEWISRDTIAHSENDLELENAKLTDQKEKLIVALQEKDEEVSKLKEEVDEAHRAKDAILVNQLNSLNNTNQLKGQWGNMKGQLREENRKVSKLEYDVERMRNESTDLMRNFNHNIQSRKNEFDELNGVIFKMSNELTAKTHKLSYLTAKIHDLNKEIYRLENRSVDMIELDELRKRNSILNDKMNSMTKYIIKRDRQTEVLFTRNEELKKKVKQLAENNLAVREENEILKRNTEKLAFRRVKNRPALLAAESQRIREVEEKMRKYEI
jgi:chromosome segregation ATPase